MMWRTYFETQLSILQLENYEVGRWWRWWIHHPTTRLKTLRKPLVWTKRLQLTVLCGLVFMLFPPLMVIVGGSIVSALNVLHRSWLKRKIRQLLTQHPLCKKIAITGSFGKTSVKDFLYTILDQCSYAVATPGSFNTYGGILRVLEQELTADHRFFVVELGAYAPGDIADMAAVIRPDFGILSAIGPQHIERFGSQPAISRTKFELFDYVPLHKLFVNWDNELICNYSKQHDLSDKLIKVSANDPVVDYVITNRVFDKTGVHITVVFKGRKTTFNVPFLFGTVMAENLSVAITAAMALGIPVAAIAKSMAAIRPPLHRLELKQSGMATLIDNTYSSNLDGFTRVIADLRQLSGSKALVTPGIVELGNNERAIHEQLGQDCASVFDTVVLVGDSVRTEGISQGLLNQKYQGRVKTIPAETTAYWQTVDALAKNHQWILLENDVSEQYL